MEEGEEEERGRRGGRGGRGRREKKRKGGFDKMHLSLSDAFVTVPRSFIEFSASRHTRRIPEQAFKSRNVLLSSLPCLVILVREFFPRDRTM